MMTSSKPKPGIRNVPPPVGGTKPNVYARFIPREEVGSFAAWKPGSLAGGPEDRRKTGTQQQQQQPAEPPKPDPEIIAQQLHAARQSGYQDGYRDGLVALEGFKQSFATQMAAQLGMIAASYGEQLDALQQDMARALAVSATNLARQIVRSELKTRPELVVAVAQEAVDALLLSAQHVTVRVHPDDHPLVAAGAEEVLAARGGRLVHDAQIARGGLVVESDIGMVDASIEARWRKASASLGVEEPWLELASELAPLSPEGDA
jgi:flagellar assembly protein FliH